jgi:hypothetical protein
MKKRIILTTSLTAVLLLLFAGAQASWWPFSSDNEDKQLGAEITELIWEDLIPNDFIQPENPLSTMSQEEIDKLMDGSEESEVELEKLKEAFYYAPVVDELDGKRVKLPAYITPLEYNENQMMNEFLLVPYVGACMHTPPPPANQVVHAKTVEAIENRSMYEAVWAIGILRAKTSQSELAEAGYQLEVEEVMPYSTE